MKPINKLVVIMFLAANVLCQHAFARQDNNDSRRPIDRTQAAAKAQQQEKGRVLRVDQTGSKYRVKVLKKNGRVVSVDVDKNTGQVHPSKDKDNKH